MRCVAPVLAGIGLVAVITVPSAGAKRIGPIDLVSQAGIRIVGEAASDRVGWAVARAGDVNGDRRMDVIIGAPTAGNNARDSSGSAYVVFGQRSPATIDLAILRAGGFRIDGATQGDAAGFAVSTAGDVNGDGLADVVVGAPEADNNFREQSGSAYVVFGQRSTAPVDLSALGARGFRIDGASDSEFAGWSVADAGDVNGDKRRDVLIGAPFAANDELDIAPEGFERSQAGSLYVVFGRAAAANVDLAALGNRGFRIEGPEQVGRAGWSAARAGDVNRDGRSDVLVGAPFTSNNERIYSGSAYVVFGKSSPETVDLRALGQRGLQVDGDVGGEIIFGGVGWSVAGPGDVNGDGRADVLIGATAADANRREDSGSAYVVFGRGAGRVDLARLRGGGFRIDGAAEFDYAASSVAGAGDLNGDGRADVIVSAEQADQNGRADSGSVYAVFGRRSVSRIDLAKLRQQGLRLDGAAADDLTGWSVSGVGDMNGDKQLDLLLGAQAASAPEREHSGTAYVAFLPDIIVPGLKVNSRSPQRVIRGSGVRVTASCRESCTLKASGSVDRPKLPLTAVSVSLRVAGTRTMRLTLPPATRERLISLLRHGTQVPVTVTVRAADAAGNTSTAKRTISVGR
jgi:FG-GAP repeat